MDTSWITLMAVGIPALLGAAYVWRQTRGRRVVAIAVVLLAVFITTASWGIPRSLETSGQSHQDKVDVLAKAFLVRYGGGAEIQSLQEVERVYIFVWNDEDIRKASMLVGTTWVELGEIE